MEPAAPGTEEDLHHAPPVSKKTTEQERLLSIKSYLPNGSYDNVFELTYNNGSEHWYCKICKCPIMGRVFYHEGGKRHSINMQTYTGKFKGKDPGSSHSDHEETTRNEVPNIKIAPGEPVPPGFEGEITKVAQIQERLDTFRSGSLLGLEYLLEIQDYDHEKEPSYLCLLCGKKGDPRTVIAHLVSYNHLQGYLQRHFPKTYQALAPFVTRQFKKNWQDCMNKIAESIENKYGRLLPHPVDAETFESKKDELYQLVHLGPHFSEKNGVTFEHLVNKDEITKVVEDDCSSKEVKIEPSSKKRSPSPPVVHKPKKPKPSGVVGRRRSLSSVSSISSSEMSDFEEKKGNKARGDVRNRQPFERRQRSRSPRPKMSRYERERKQSPLRRPDYRADRNTDRNDRGRGDRSMPWNRPDYVRSRNEPSNDRRSRGKDDKMEEFRKLSTAIENDMEKVLKQHKVNPEKHPQYSDEWKIFWNRRYKELQGEGKDASKYDFKPEWIVYWNEKIVELHKQEVKNKIEALRKRLGLVEPSPISFKITTKKKGSQDSKPAPMAAQPDQDHEIIIIDDKDDDSRSPKRSHSPWESETTLRSKPDARRLSLDRISSPERIVDRGRNRSRSRDRDRDNRVSRDRQSRDRDWFGHRSSDRNSRDRSSLTRDRRDYPRRDSRERDFRSREKSWERDIIYHRESRKDPKLDIYKPPPVMRDVTRKPVDYSHVPPSMPSPEEDDGDINIVAVLRLLTALEDKLGSLGPKVIDMLANALAMEKKEANSSETLLDSEINCVIFETIKEKLKGALHAGLVDYAQEKAFKTAIKKIASLIHIAGTRKVEEPKNVDPVKVPGIGTVDKAAIAKQIATALVLQGKTDVTHTELEQLINAVVGMAEASKNSDKPMTTASFLETLNAKKEEPPKPVEVKAVETPPPVETQTSKDKDTMEGLSDSDLQTLLQNFKDLSTEEQHGLITYLKKMEAKEPERVEKLRKFVNLTQPDEHAKDAGGRISPFSRKLQNSDEPAPVDNSYDDFEDDRSDNENKDDLKVEEPKPKVKIDSDDEEYSFEDVFKAADKNVKDIKLVKERKLIEDTIKRDNSDSDVLNDAKALIANIMVSIASKSSPRNNSPLVTSSRVPPNASTIQNAGVSNVNNSRNLEANKPIFPNIGGSSNSGSNAGMSSMGLNSGSMGQNSANMGQSFVNMGQSAGGMGQNSGMGQSSSMGSNMGPNLGSGSSSGPGGGPRFNQPVQYPIKNNPYGNYAPYGNNYNYNQNQNQFRPQNPRFGPSGRGHFNPNNRGNGNFNSRW